MFARATLNGLTGRVEDQGPPVAQPCIKQGVPKAGLYRYVELTWEPFMSCCF